MITLENTKNSSLLVAKFVAALVICALMYKGMSILARDEIQVAIPSEFSNNHTNSVFKEVN